MSRSIGTKDAASLDDNDDQPSKRQRRWSRRINWQHCCDIEHLPKELYCSGCVLVDSSSRMKKKDRSTYTSNRYICYNGWKRDVGKAPVNMKAHVQAIKAWITKNYNVDCDKAFDEPEI